MGVVTPFVKGAGIDAAGRKRKPKVDKALFGHRLGLALAQLHWTSAKLARELDVSRQLAATWKRGEAVPSGATAARLPEILGVAEDWLFPKAGTTPQGRQKGQAGAGTGLARAGGASTAIAAAVTRLITRAGEVLAPQVEAAIITVTSMLAARVGQLVQEMLQQSELGYTPAGRKAVIEFLRRTAEEFHDCGADVSDLLLYANRLERGDERPT